MDDLLALATELVAIPSHEDETAAGDFVESWLRRETDADVTRDEAGNVIARKRPDATVGGDDADDGDTGEFDQLALVGHHDVVPPDESQATADGEYVLEERDGRLHGRGTADMKGAVAAAMLAFRDADLSPVPDAGAAGDADHPGELVLASFVGEEIGGVGARHAVDRGFSPDHAVVGEGSTNYAGSDVTDVAVAHRGRRGSTITARGTAAHASEPDAGVNAIYRAAEAIEVVRALETPSVEVADETLSGSTAVTEIEGGSAMNVIPDRCSFTLDERTVPSERAALERIAELDGVEWTVEQDLPPMRCDDGAFADAALEAANAAQTATPELVTKPHATDAGWLSAAGTACVICGPAEPGEAHTAEESVSIAVLERCREIYWTVAESWLAPG